MNQRIKKKLSKRNNVKNWEKYRRRHIVERVWKRIGPDFPLDGMNFVLITGKNLKHPHRVMTLTGCYPSAINQDERVTKELEDILFTPSGDYGVFPSEIGVSVHEMINRWQQGLLE